MAEFDPAFNYMILNEDYPQTDPRFGRTEIDNDGGQVRFGLNSNSFPGLLTTDFYSAPVDVAFKKAYSLYNITQWRAIRGDSINSQAVASKLLDMAVNMGSDEAAKLVQRVVNVDVDGVIGPVTINAINAVHEDQVLSQLVYWWKWFILKEVSNHPTDASYKTEWETRAQKLPAAV